MTGTPSEANMATIRDASTRTLGLPLLQRSEEHTSELQSQSNLVCRLLLEKKKKKQIITYCLHKTSLYKSSQLFSRLYCKATLPYRRISPTPINLPYVRLLYYVAATQAYYA